MKRQMCSRTPTCRVFMLCIVFGILQGYFSLPQGYPYQWGGYVYYPAPYIPPHSPMYSYPESCCCFGYEIETVFPKVSNQKISGDRNTMPEIVAQITSKADHPTTTSRTIGQLVEGLRAEANPGISEEKSSRFLQQTTIQLTTELIIEPKTVSIYDITAELSTTTSESTKQSKRELSTKSIAKTNTEPITESSKVAPEGTESTTESAESATVTAYEFTKKLTEPKQKSSTESTIKPTESATESAKLITEITAESIIKMTEDTQGSATESTTNEYASSTETAQHLPETTDGSTTKSSESRTRSTDKSTQDVTESTTQTTVDFRKETPTATTVSTTDSMPKEENQYNVEEGITTSTIRSTEGNMIINTVTGKEYFLGRSTEVTAESNDDNYQHLNNASHSELTTENNEVSRSGFTTYIFSGETYDEISQTEEDDFPYINAA